MSARFYGKRARELREDQRRTALRTDLQMLQPDKAVIWRGIGIRCRTRVDGKQHVTEYELTGKGIKRDWMTLDAALNHLLLEEAQQTGRT